MDLKLAGKVVLITGSGRGIWLATAKAFAAEGCRIMLSARSAEQLRQAEAALRRSGASVASHAADVSDPDEAASVLDWAKTKGAVGVSLMPREEQISDPTDPRLNRAFAAAGRQGVPVNFLCWGGLDDGAEAVRRNPDTVIVIDHLSLLQPNEPPPLAEPWADLPKLLALAAYPNVRVKISGACTLSRKRFPYDDIWDPVLQIIDAFGIDRCMWGTDWTRTSAMLTYEQGVAPFRNTDRLSDSDRSKLMGGTLKKVYGW